MTQELVRLAIAASDNLARLLNYQELLQIALEQFDQPSEATLRRADLLLSVYLFLVEACFRDLEDELREIRQQLYNLEHFQ